MNICGIFHDYENHFLAGTPGLWGVESFLVCLRESLEILKRIFTTLHNRT